MRNQDRIKSFVINVSSNTYRLNHFMAQVDKIGMPVNVFSAVTPQTMDDAMLRYNDVHSRRFTGRAMLPTEKACALSHLTLWQQLENDADAEFYLILEDDALISANIAEILNEIDLKKIGFLKLSGKKKRPMRTVQNLLGGRKCVKYAYGPLDTAAYLISKHEIEKLRAYCELLFTPFDLMLDRSYDHGVDVYGVLPYPVYAEFCLDPSNPLFSDIGIRGKYAEDITLLEKTIVRAHRFWGGLKRHWAAIKLYLN